MTAGAGRAARRELAVAVVLSTLGGALALYASSRTWIITETPRPEPLPAVRTATSGRDAVPWAAAMAFVALAGGLGLLATRRTGRLVIGLALVLAGALVVAGAGAGLDGVAGAGVDGVAGAGSLGWPIAFGLGGLAVLAAGALAVARGRRWAAMGRRYEGPAGDESPDAWDALDRGEDPTTSG